MRVHGAKWLHLLRFVFVLYIGSDLRTVYVFVASCSVFSAISPRVPRRWALYCCTLSFFWLHARCSRMHTWLYEPTISLIACKQLVVSLVE